MTPRAGGTPIALTVEDAEGDMRLEKFIQLRMPGVSRGSVRRMLKGGGVLVDGCGRPKGHRLRRGQLVQVPLASRTERPTPQPGLGLDIVAATEDYIVIDKPDGMHCHPLVPGERDTVANAIAAAFPECVEASAQVREAGLVHRLDWCTSGLLLAARHPNSYGRLRGMFSSGKIHKQYLALVHGLVTESGKIHSYLRTMPGDRTRMQVVFPEQCQEGRRAKTGFKPIQQLCRYTLVEAASRTGRRHQIRVHLAHAGHPLVGDTRYGGREEEGIKGAFLHASRLALSDEGQVYHAPLPDHRLELIRRIEARR